MSSMGLTEELRGDCYRKQACLIILLTSTSIFINKCCTKMRALLINQMTILGLKAH